MEKEKEIEKEIENKRNAISKIKFGLSRHDRRLLKLYFGYIALENGRKATKSKHDACLFVREALFDEEDSPEEQAFSLEDEIDWKTFNDLAGIFSKDRTDVQAFLTSEGGLTDLEEVAIIRSHQSFGRALPEELLIGNRNAYLIILLLGKVSEKLTFWWRFLFPGRKGPERSKSPRIYELVLVSSPTRRERGTVDCVRIRGVS